MKISVITPVYNRADSIVACLQSVTRCLVPGLEVEQVVTDDGSSDASAALVADYAATHPHVRLVRLEQNSGCNAARNAAISAARGEWILFLDSDDTLAPGALQGIAATMEAYPGHKHYLFGCDDYQGENADSQCVYTFGDFLEGKVCRDFGHVFLRSTALELPFDTRLRVHEGLFFLRFYRLAGSMLYTPMPVLLTDRTRSDHASFFTRKTNDRAFADEILYTDILLQFFHHELMATTERRAVMARHLLLKYKSAVLLGRYKEAGDAAAAMHELGMKKPALFAVAASTRTGRLLGFAAKTATRIKWAIKSDKFKT